MVVYGEESAFKVVVTDPVGKRREGLLVDNKGNLLINVNAGIALPPLDFQFEVRRGRVPGLTAKNLQGHADGMGTSEQGIWGDSANITPGIIGLYDTPVTVKVASTDANDTVAGTGAQTVLLVGNGVDDNVQQEVIAMNGQTEVTSSKVYHAVTQILVATVGSGLNNAGNIWAGNGTFTAGVPATKYMFMEAEDTVSRSSVVLVPRNHIHWIIQLVFTIADTNKSLDIHINSYDGKIHRVVAPFEIGVGVFNTASPAVPPLVEDTLWWLTANVNTGSADVTTILAYNEEHLEESL